MTTDSNFNESSGVSAEEQSMRWLRIPFEQLQADTLTAILEEFISREGTDYGLQEVSFEQQLEKARQSMLSGDVVIVYDSQLESCQLLKLDEYRKLCDEL